MTFDESEEAEEIGVSEGGFLRERLVTLHTLDDGKLALVLERPSASDLPNLWKRRSDQFFHIDGLPCLGTGKLDLRKVREMASRFSIV